MCRRFGLLIAGWLLQTIGCQSLRDELPYEDLVIRECVLELEKHGIGLPPRTNRAYVFSVPEAATVVFSSYETGWFGEREEDVVTQSWTCDVRSQSTSMSKPIVRFLSLVRGDDPLVGEPDYEIVPAEHPEDEVRVRAYERRESRFFFVKEKLLSEIRSDQSRRLTEQSLEEPTQ